MDLTEADRRVITKAGEVGALRDTDAMRERYGGTDGDLARAHALGEAQFLLVELVAIVTRLTKDDSGPPAATED